MGRLEHRAEPTEDPPRAQTLTRQCQDQILTTRKKVNPPQPNAFADGFLHWMDSPDGELSLEVVDTVFALLDNVDVDAEARQLQCRMVTRQNTRELAFCSIQCFQHYPGYPIGRAVALL